jgi:hypothetical protein
MVRCWVFGHRYRFAASGPEMRWTCARCGHEGGVKRYPTADDARRYAAAFDREDRTDLGRRAPYFGLLPLRLARLLRRRAAEH